MSRNICILEEKNGTHFLARHATQDRGIRLLVKRWALALDTAPRRPASPMLPISDFSASFAGHLRNSNGFGQRLDCAANKVRS